MPKLKQKRKNYSETGWIVDYTWVYGEGKVKQTKKEVRSGVDYERFLKAIKRKVNTVANKKKYYKKHHIVSHLYLDATVVLRKVGSRELKSIDVTSGAIFVPPGVDKKIRLSLWADLARQLEDDEQVTVGSARYIKDHHVGWELKEAKLDYEKVLIKQIDFKIYRLIKPVKKK